MKPRYYLTLSCPNQPVIVAAVAACLFEAGANILEAQQFDDLSSNRFSMRVEFDVPQGGSSAQNLSDKAAPIAARYRMQWKLRSRSRSI